MSDKKKGLPDIIIRSEAEAYELLAFLSEGGEPDPYGAIRFEGWPTLNLRLKGEQFDQTITATVMKGLIELQQGVYRSYLAAKSKGPRARLTEAERNEFELRVKVKGGSSIFEINFQEIAKNLAGEFAKTMTGTEVLIAIVSIAVLYFGQSAWKIFLEERRKTREKEVTDQTQRETLETLRFTSKEETKRAEIMAEIVKRNPTIGKIEHIADDSRGDLLRSFGRSDTSKIDDIPLSTDVTEMLMQNARRKADDVRLDGLYRLVKLDWTNPLHFKVRAESLETGHLVDAEVQDDSLTGKYKDALKAAEWSRRPIRLQINAKRVGDGAYRDAVIISAELPAHADDELLK